MQAAVVCRLRVKSSRKASYHHHAFLPRRGGGAGCGRRSIRHAPTSTLAIRCGVRRDLLERDRQKPRYYPSDDMEWLLQRQRA